MKKLAIVLMAIIVICSGILYYKIINTKKELAKAEEQKLNIENEYNYNEYRDDVIEPRISKSTQVKNNRTVSNTNITSTNTQNENNNYTYQNNSQRTVTTPTNIQQPKTNINTQIQNQTNNSNKGIPQTNTQNKVENKVVEQPKKEEPKYIVIESSTLVGKFSGYATNNIYMLEKGMAYIQTDYTAEYASLINPKVEIRLYAGLSDTKYAIYVEGMQRYAKVDMMPTRRSTTVFPQKEYSYYNGIIQSLAGSGVLNSSATKPYTDKMKDIENNWTNLGTGRVIGLANLTYWTQISSNTGTFNPNANVIIATYNNKTYMHIDGISGYIEVEEYNN